jgi:uncharacterized protein with NAD-binding domain and iron-sulfur cluster
MAAKIKVAVLGGGCGAMAAAFELTKTPGYEVTVYQQGWRLGGKCASGRAEPHQRIEEHGLHMLIGFYEEAFKLMSACYDEYTKASAGHVAFPTFHDALIPQNRITLQEPVGLAWRSWNVDLKPAPGFPGTGNPPSLEDVVQSFVEWLFASYRRVKADVQRIDVLRLVQKWATKSEPWVERILSDVAPGARAYRLAGRLRERPGSLLLQELVRLLALILADLEAITKKTETATKRLDVTLQHDLLALRLGYAAFKGLVADVLLHDGDFSRINHLDFRSWLMTHGATKADVWSAPIKGLYDLGFAYVDGVATDPTKAQAAAGVALYVALQLLFACRGGVLWKMRAGAGDILFAPLYEVLRSRGVTFKFFHRVEKLTLSEDGTTVDAVRITRQADTSEGRDGQYDPLIDVPFGDGSTSLRCWPAEPRWEQLPGISEEEKAQLRENSFESSLCQADVGDIVLRRRGSEEETLEDGTRSQAASGSDDGSNEFDHVILGLSLAGLPSICEELIERRPSWKSMVTGIPTVQTQSLQLWMTPALAELGWDGGETVSIAYVEPHDAWGEMSHLLAAERWDDPASRWDAKAAVPPSSAGDSEAPSASAKSIHYFCSVLPEFPPGTPRCEQERVARENAGRFVESALGHLWPKAVDTATGELKKSLVASGYVRINVDPSERYVLSVPGSIVRRLPPDCSTFANLYLAGDWVTGRVNSGSVEAAMAGGVRAADALRKAAAASAGVMTSLEPGPVGVESRSRYPGGIASAY